MNNSYVVLVRHGITNSTAYVKGAGTEDDAVKEVLRHMRVEEIASIVEIRIVHVNGMNVSRVRVGMEFLPGVPLS